MSDAIDTRRVDDRFRTDQDGITTFHSFSYGRHYDPENVGFGPVIAINEELVPPGGGYDAHRHSDVTIFTLVLDGRLAHEDTGGRSYVINAGELRSISAGAGIEHSERNASQTEPLRFLQVMTREEPVDVQVRLFGDGDAESVVGPAVVHVTSGRLRVGGELLNAGDEARLPAAGPYDVTASGAAGALIVQVR
ncbi:MAG: pirin family protein [Aeromicrobium sp.]